MESQNWFVVEITADAAAAEAVEFAFNELDASGTEFHHSDKTPTETLTVTGYFSAAPDEEIVQNQLNEALRIYGFATDAVKSVARRPQENLDWLYEWKKHWRPTRIGKFIIAPTWYEIEENAGEIIVRIDPAMAFGTGTHQTTQLCLRAIEENYRPEMSFLDVGTGTGILAVAAAKMQSERQKEKGRIEACDTDEDAVEIAVKNAELNQISGLEFYAGSISEETENFDFVCANLTADVIVPILPLLIEKSKQILVLSGILVEQEDLVTSELKRFQINAYKIETDGEWISVEVKK